MALIKTLTDGVSRLKFYNEHGTPNAKTFASFVGFEYLPVPDLIRKNDFCSEFIDNTAGGIQDGRYPPSVDPAKIVGFTPQCDALPGDADQPNFFGGRVLQCENPGGDTRAVQFFHTQVNEFYKGVFGGITNQDPGHGMNVSYLYRLDGEGNLAIDIAAMDALIAPCIQNIHMVELNGSKSLFDFNYEVGVYSGGATRVMRVPPELFFKLIPDPTKGNTYLLFDENPKSSSSANVDELMYNEWYYVSSSLSTSSRWLPTIIGVSRRSDGSGILVVHGKLPQGSQPLVLGMYTPDEGVIPIISQFAYLGFNNRSTTIFKIYMLPFTAINYGAQCKKAIGLCEYDNPVSVTPW